MSGQDNFTADKRAINLSLKIVKYSEMVLLDSLPQPSNI